ncbi:hypothetical protein JTE90_003669 [Oedothorax gibbosus]|uniref:Uncharacterized protein n=1 Tax=Oedothorax gibbosus TaxID=931172 RepID=A0AAV6VQW5_9ARAC|nr:hypothetical protein JTE90_003669 [Oedothorax gibbosus]
MIEPFAKHCPTPSLTTDLDEFHILSCLPTSKVSPIVATLSQRAFLTAPTAQTTNGKGLSNVAQSSAFMSPTAARFIVAGYFQGGVCL